MSTMTREQATQAWRNENDQGNGFAPDDEAVSDVVRAYVADGATLLFDRTTTDEIAVIRTEDGRVIGIGGGADGGSAWGCFLETPPHA